MAWSTYEFEDFGNNLHVAVSDGDGWHIMSADLGKSPQPTSVARYDGRILVLGEGGAIFTDESGTLSKDCRLDVEAADLDARHLAFTKLIDGRGSVSLKELKGPLCPP